jgi:single-stranded-DNA-specific exonuclease RecJ
MRHAVWHAPATDVQATARLCVEAGVSPLVARLLHNRDVQPADVARFLRPSLTDTHDPLLLPDMGLAVERILSAIDSGEKITVYGDYDVDGTTATALLLGVLRRAGAEADFYIPDRAAEGYGVNPEAMRLIREGGASVVITVDCGITAREPIAVAREIGLDVIVTDHHEVDPDRLPNPGDAVALIDPRRADSEYPFPDLAGVGLAYKLGQAVLTARDADASLDDQLDLVALGTIADISNLQDENRVLAKLGLAVMSERRRPGIKALCDAAGVKADAELQSYHVGFVLGPRINAAGRLDTAHIVVELLTTDDAHRAREIAEHLNEANRARREVERAITDEATERIRAEHDLDRDPIIVVAREGWHPGVVGIVASRLVERFWRPAVVIGVEGSKGKGSCRSIPGFHIQEALMECAEHMTTFGGHAAAAGLSLDIESLPALREQLVSIAAARLTPDDLRRKVKLDAVLPLAEIPVEAVEELALLEPFGEGNPAPRFGFRGLGVVGEPRVMGQELQHLSATLTDGLNSVRVLAWNAADKAVGLRTPGAEVSIAGRVEINEYRGRRNVQVTVNDWRIEGEAATVDAGVYPGRETPSDVRIIDSRQRAEKAPYLGRVLSRGGLSLIYVRDDHGVEQAVKLLRDLGHASAVARVESSTPDDVVAERAQTLGRDGVRALVTARPVTEWLSAEAQSQVYHVVFCHPPADDPSFLKALEPTFVERDEAADMHEDAAKYVHLLFNARDLDLDVARLEGSRSDAARLRRIYKVLSAFSGPCALDEWREAADATDRESVTLAASVFEEIGIAASTADGYQARPGERTSLDDSSAYREARAAALASEMQLTLWRARTARDYWELLLRHRRGLSEGEESAGDGVTAGTGAL